MKTILLFLVFTISHVSLQAQDTWNDYVIGLPKADYFTAKKTIAKEWGINYQPIFAGCVLSDKMSDKAKVYQASNKIYFETLAEKYGQDWMQNFELEVRKEVHRNSTREKGVCYEIASDDRSEQFYATKKMIAKNWGIDYEAKFISEDISDTEKTALVALFSANDDYTRQLKNTFGEDWAQKLNQEVEFEVAKQKLAASDYVWVDYVVGKPSMDYFEAKKTVAKEWDIHYKVEFKGCKRMPEMEQEEAEVEKLNVRYFKILEKKHGKNWNARFDIAVEKQLAQDRLEQK